LRAPSLPRLVKDLNVAPALIGWLPDRLEHLNTSDEDPARLPVALAER